MSKRNWIALLLVIVSAGGCASYTRAGYGDPDNFVWQYHSQDRRTAYCHSAAEAVFGGVASHSEHVRGCQKDLERQGYVEESYWNALKYGRNQGPRHYIWSGPGDPPVANKPAP